MDKFYIYWRFAVSSGVDCGWRKYFVRPLPFEKAKMKLTKLRNTTINIEFCIAGSDGRIVKE